jgi:predicted DNA-binding protein (MmcQ/YjbR family)
LNGANIRIFSIDDRKNGWLTILNCGFAKNAYFCRKNKKTMNIEELREYCLSIKDATEDMPFGDDLLVLRVLDKWFAVIPLDDPELNISVKCDPTKAIELRERYKCVTAAWHFNKKYWNNIILNYDMDDETVKFWIRHSVEEVVKKLPKKTQTEYWGGK